MSLYQGNMSGVNDWSITLWLMLLSYGYGVWKNPSQTSPVLAIHVSVWYIQALTVLSGLQRDYLYFKSGWNYKTNKQTKKRRKECSEKFTDVECVLRSAQVIFSKTMFRIRKTETVDNFSNIRNEKTWPFKTEAFQHMGNQRSSSHEEFEFAPVSCCCLHCRE